MSPQMLTGERFNAFLKVERNRDVIRWVLVEEAHLVLEEDSTFCVPYSAIRNMRPRLPSSAVWCAVTGELMLWAWICVIL